jgi:hypothetical protein
MELLEITMSGKSSKRKNVTGQIVKSLNPEKSGFFEKGHLEGDDVTPFIPLNVREALRRAVKSGQLDIKISDEPNEDGEWVIDVTAEG